MGQGVFALQSPLPPLPRSVAPPAIPSFVHLPQQFLPNGDSMININFTDKVVEAAVQEALDNSRWPTAYALRTLYDDQRGNERMVRLIDAIYSRRADETQIQEFKNVMRHKKKEGKKDRTGEYYFNGDGSDPPPRQTSFSAVNAQSTYSTPSARSGSRARTLSDGQARRSSFNLSSVSASPYKGYDHSQHISKKHKGNNFQPTNMEMNGSASASASIKTTPKQEHQQNGTSNSMGRERSNSDSSSSSSLSSLDERVLGGEYTGDSSRIPQGAPNQNHTAAGLGEGDGDADIAAHTQTHTRSTPYANTNNSASAEPKTGLSARNRTQPITAPTKLGPKTYTFSTVSPAATLPSSSHHRTHRHSHSSTNNTMTPAALLPSAALSASGQPPHQQIIFKEKKDLSKVTDHPLAETDRATRMKRDARKVTDRNTPNLESFERYKIQIPILQEPESASDGGESVAVTEKKRPTIRLLNKKTTRQSGANYDSDGLSSPTQLSFQPDLAPGSLYPSRAGTPNALNRPTRRAKTGTGLRVKTS